MKRSTPNLLWLAAGALILLPLMAITWLYQPAPKEVRGKSLALPLGDSLSPEQARAEELALSDAQVQALTVGHRSEVFGVRRIVADQYTEKSKECATATCYQVEIYNFDENAAVFAVVNAETDQVLDVQHLLGMHPGMNQRLIDLAFEIALNEPQVIDILGYKPTQADMAPVNSSLGGTACEQGHICGAPTFEMGDRVLWAVVDLTDETFAGINWTSIVDTSPNYVTFEPEGGCPAGGSVTRDGWQMDYATTGTDSFKVYNVTFNGDPVLTSASLVEWHADYGTSGYVDTTGCGGGGGGFPIYPFGETRTEDLLDEDSNVVGFELIQDFRMGSWGSSCNYRYEQHMQFYDDGSFRIASGAYGKGCGTNALYRPLVRIDLAAGDDSDNTVSQWDGTEFVDITTETYLEPAPDGNGWFRFYPSNEDGASFRVTNGTGGGYDVIQDIGQFDALGKGGFAFWYITQYQEDEGGSLDLPAIGNCCNDDYQQGPHLFVDGENVANENVVIWYIPQMDTDASDGGDGLYCWTEGNSSNPGPAHPCFAGPLFTPMNTTAPAVAGFTHNSPIVLGETAVFENTSTGASPLSYEWSFGDGNTSTESSPSHTYSASGTYTVVLTTSNNINTSVVQEVIEVVPNNVAAVAGFSADSETVLVNTVVAFTNESGGTPPINYNWDFGTGDTSADENPTYTYTEVGSYEVMLTAENAFGDSSASTMIDVQAAIINVTVPKLLLVDEEASFLADVQSNHPNAYLWQFGDGSSSSEANPNHTYTQPGEYTVTLRVTNADGETTYTFTVEVRLGEHEIYLPLIMRQ